MDRVHERFGVGQVNIQMDRVLKKKEAPEIAVVAIEVKREAVFDHVLDEIEKAGAGQPITHWGLDQEVEGWRSIVIKVRHIFSHLEGAC